MLENVYHFSTHGATSHKTAFFDKPMASDIINELLQITAGSKNAFRCYAIVAPP
jgi:hypothetical protein